MQDSGIRVEALGLGFRGQCAGLLLTLARSLKPLAPYMGISKKRGTPIT